MNFLYIFSLLKSYKIMIKVFFLINDNTIFIYADTDRGQGLSIVNTSKNPQLTDPKSKEGLMEKGKASQNKISNINKNNVDMAQIKNKNNGKKFKNIFRKKNEASASNETEKNLENKNKNPEKKMISKDQKPPSKSPMTKLREYKNDLKRKKRFIQKAIRFYRA